MFVTADYCQVMARYNAWQNEGLCHMVPAMPLEEVRREWGAFFGSILGTLKQFLWVDRMWRARLTGSEKPCCGIKESVSLMPDAMAWAADLFLPPAEGFR